VQTAINYKNLNLSVPFFCQKLLAGLPVQKRCADWCDGVCVFAFSSIILFTVDASVGGNMFSSAWGLWIEYTVRVCVSVCGLTWLLCICCFNVWLVLQ